MRIAHYAKGLVAGVGMVAVTAAEFLGEASLAGQDFAVMILALATALGVIGVPNEPKHPVDDLME